MKTDREQRRNGSHHKRAQRQKQIFEREQKRAKRNHARTTAEWFDAHSD